jgi:hypothetical protein
MQRRVASGRGCGGTPHLDDDDRVEGHRLEYVVLVNSEK